MLLKSRSGERRVRGVGCELGTPMAALWNLQAALESTLAEPLQAGYAEILAAARTKLAQASGL